MTTIKQDEALDEFVAAVLAKIGPTLALYNGRWWILENGYWHRDNGRGNAVRAILEAREGWHDEWVVRHTSMLYGINRVLARMTWKLPSGLPGPTWTPS